jgi:hypothetical protein
VPWTKTYFSLFDAFRDLDNNSLNGTLAIGNISSLIRKLPNGNNDGNLNFLIITNNNISNVEYNNSDIIDVKTFIW